MSKVIGGALILGGLGFLLKTFIAPRTTDETFRLSRRDKIVAVADRRELRVRRRADVGGIRDVLRAVHALPVPAVGDRMVGTDVTHAAALLWVAGAGHLLHGNVDLHAIAWLLVGSIPGVLVGSHLSIRVPERALRTAFAFVLALSGIKLVGVPEATTIIEVSVGARRDRAGRLVGPPAAAAAPGRRRPRIESSGRGPGPVERTRSRPARGDCRCLRDHRGSQARALPDLRDEGADARLLAERPGRSPLPRSRSACGSASASRPGSRPPAAGASARSCSRATSGPGRPSTSSGTGSPTAAWPSRTVGTCRREAPAVAPHDRAAEHAHARHGSAEGHRQASAVPDPLARRRPSPRHLPRSLHAERAGTRDHVRGRDAGGVHAIAEAVRRAALEREAGGKPARPRRNGYVLTIAAHDRAGNVSKPYPFAIAHIRYVVLARTRVVVRPRSALRCACRRMRRRCAGSCGAGPACSAAARCTSVLPPAAASSTSTSSSATTRHAVRWSSRDQRFGASGGRRRCGRARRC